MSNKTEDTMIREINIADYINWVERGYRLVFASYGPYNKVREVWKRDEPSLLARGLARYKQRIKDKNE